MAEGEKQDRLRFDTHTAEVCVLGQQERKPSLALCVSLSCSLLLASEQVAAFGYVTVSIGWQLTCFSGEELTFYST